MFSDQFEEIAKGFQYAQEPHRLIVVDSYRAILSGHHRNHVMTFVDGEWSCSCSAWRTQFHGRGMGWCRHTIALTRILAAMQSGTVEVRQAQTVY